MRKRAFINVHNRKRMVEFADALRRLDYDIFAPEPARKFLTRADVKCLSIISLRSGRRPGPSGEDLYFLLSSLLSPDRKRNPEFRLVAADLYPLSKIISQENFEIAELPEYLDIVNSSVLRSAAKNFAKVITLCDNEDYGWVIKKLAEKGDLPAKDKRRLAAKAYNYCAYYDASVSNYISGNLDFFSLENPMMALEKISSPQEEDKSRRAFLCKPNAAPARGMANLAVIRGGSLSVNHYLDINLGFETVSRLRENACLTLKHGHIHAVAFSRSAAENLKSAAEESPPGAILVTGGKMDLESSRLAASENFEAVAAIDFSEESLRFFKSMGQRKPKIIRYPPLVHVPGEIEIKTVHGGFIMREGALGEENLSPSAGPEAEPMTMNVALKAWNIVKSCVSYSAVFANNFKMLAVSRGQKNSAESALKAAAELQNRHPILAYKEILAFASDMPLSPPAVRKIAECRTGAVICPKSASEKENRENARICAERGISLIHSDRRYLT